MNFSLGFLERAVPAPQQRVPDDQFEHVGRGAPKSKSEFVSRDRATYNFEQARAGATGERSTIVSEMDLQRYSK